MFWLQALLAVVVVCGTVVVAGGRGDGITLPRRADPYEWAGRDEPIHEPDLDELRIGVAARGYRMDEVDAVIERLGTELGERDERIAHLEHVIEVREHDDEPNPFIRRHAAVGDGADLAGPTSTFPVAPTGEISASPPSTDGPPTRG